MITSRHRHALPSIAAALLALAHAIGAHAAADDVAQVPLTLSGQAPPNFTFVLDDSGSMQWSYLESSNAPDDTITNYVVPIPDDLYGVNNYAEIVPTFDDDNVHNLLTRSVENNALYYNPDVVYEPWSNSDGSSRSDADPTNAHYNPSRTGLGGLDLTAEQTQSATWFDDGGTNDPDQAFCAPCGGDHTFWPITYYTYDGSGDRLKPKNYEKVQVRGNTIYVDGNSKGAIKAPPGASQSTWGAAEVQQNFANWFTYTRSRILAARAGVGRAFARQSGDFRVAHGAINEDNNDIDGVTMDTLVRGVRDFTGTDRDDFFDFLYGHPIPREGTPLRTALQDAGDYYERSDSGNPWNEDPSSASGADIECRQAYTILTTDGFWNGADPGVGNTDGTNGGSINNPDGPDFQYTADDPFEDSHSDTLADVAMDYWRRDLRAGLDNIVEPLPEDPAFWQHMVTFGVAFGATGTLDPNNDLQSLKDGSLQWPDPTDAQDAERIDDLWHAGVNSRGDFISALDPQQFATEFDALLDRALERTEGTSAAVATNTTRLTTSTLIYQGRFNSADWSGDVLALEVDPNDGTVDANNPAWKASNQLPDHTNRNIFTIRNGSGTEFLWSDLSPAQRDELDDNPSTDVFDDDNQGQARLAWLRGDTSQEERNGGSFRDRFNGLLGDVVNSDPYLARGQNFGYVSLPGDAGATYADYLNSKGSRQDMLYVGANDGMLHAFDGRKSGGDEEFAYMPDAAIDEVNRLTSPDYKHRFYVDEAPRVADVYADLASDGNNDTDGNGSTEDWHSVLVGAMAAGGKAVFALDVSNPTAFEEADVLWEFTDPKLGFSFGQPNLVRLNDGTWAALFGDGYDNTTTDSSGNTIVAGNGSATAGLFIVPLEDPSNARFLDTGVGTASDPNGIAEVTPVDLDGDKVTDVVYGGDLQGNIWKFDLRGNSNQWSVDKKFQATGPDGNPQPITVAPAIGPHDDSGVELMLYFGTGKFFREGDINVPSDPQIQSFYAIADRDDNKEVQKNKLVQQEIVDQSNNFRVLSDKSVDFATKDGWFINLKNPNLSNGEGERVFDSAILRGDRVIFQTNIPDPDVCEIGGSSWILEMNATDGSRIEEGVFDVDGDGDVDDDDRVKDVDNDGDKEHAGGLGLVGLSAGMAILDTDRAIEFKEVSKSSGTVETVTESSGTAERGRQSWRQYR